MLGMQTASQLQQKTYMFVLLGLLALGVAVALTLANYNYTRGNFGGNDFLTRWLATRLFLLEGLSPYSDATAEQIQRVAYGRPAQSGEDEMRMAYPLYSVILFAPFALIPDYAWARAVWMTVLEIASAVLALLSVQLVQWKPNLFNTALLMLFTALWYHGVRPIINGNIVTLIALAIVAALWAIRHGWDSLAGALLTLATIKPHLALLPLGVIVLWSLSHQRWAVLGWLAGTGLGLTLLGMLFIPDWLWQNLSEVRRYTSYTPPTTPGAALAQWWPAGGYWLGALLSLLVGAALLWGWRATWRQNFEKLVWATSLTLTLSQWSGLTTDPGNYILLFLPLMLVMAQAQLKWEQTASIGISATLVILLIGLWVLFLATLERGDQPLQSPIMFFPLPAVVLLGLWITHPTSTPQPNLH